MHNIPGHAPGKDPIGRAADLGAGVNKAGNAEGPIGYARIMPPRNEDNPNVGSAAQPFTTAADVAVSARVRESDREMRQVEAQKMAADGRGSNRRSASIRDVLRQSIRASAEFRREIDHVLGALPAQLDPAADLTLARLIASGSLTSDHRMSYVEPDANHTQYTRQVLAALSVESRTASQRLELLLDYLPLDIPSHANDALLRILRDGAVLR